MSQPEKPLYPSEDLFPSEDLYPSDIEDILCKTSGQRLAQLSTDGLLLYCKECRKAHLYPYSMIEYIAQKKGLCNNGNDSAEPLERE